VKGFRLDTNLCTGCGACAVACAIENDLTWGTSWRWIETFNPRHVPGLPSYHLSLACNHCANAPCMRHCPSLAYSRDDVTGAVLLDPDKCIGCRYCTWACPYDAPRFDVQAGVVSKCTFCHHRQLEGLAPACVQQCPTGALTFGDLETSDGAASVPGFPETEARPSVRFVASRSEVPMAPAEEVRRPGDDGSAAPTSGQALSALSSSSWATPYGADPAPRKTSLATEGPLVLFTLLAASLAGVGATPAGRRVIGLAAFLALAAVAAGASTLHLGRKGRAWRALLNVRRSWLSREITFFSLFAAASAAVLSPFPTPTWAGGVVTVLAFALLFAVDRVYGMTRTPGLGVHSAGVLLTGVMIAGIAGGSAVVWGGALTMKIISYTVRKVRFAEEERPARPWWTAVRLASGLLASSLMILAAPQGPVTDASLAVPALVLLALGEIVDRCEFYLELDVTTPRGAMSLALAEAVS
jgi:Fe-S-cluster-containing dehydrogenase component/DMSO reductase anchor subunit